MKLFKNKFKNIFLTLIIILNLVQLPTTANALTACTPTSTTSGSRTILTFTSTTACDWTVPANVLAIDILVVAGGGGGGFERGGGGGGGGVAYSAALSVSPNAVHAVTVGSGGAASTAANQQGSDGGNSSFVRSSDSTTLVQAGGGGGGGSHNGAVVGTGDGRSGANASAQVSAGGSGGGSSFNFTNNSSRWFYRGGGGGTGTSNGLNGSGSYMCDTNDTTHDTIRLTGGGGGASAAGAGGASGNQSPTGCNTFTFSMRPKGGDGLAYSISGSSVTYGGGGGGADGRTNGETSYKSLGSGPGGAGGGGRGQQSYSANLNSSDSELTPTATALPAQSGTDGLGGGGGGGITAAGRGGNGVVIISYAEIIFSAATPAQDSTISANLNSTNSISTVGLEGEVSGTTYLVSISATNMPTGSSLKFSNVTGGTASFGFPAMSTSATFTNLSFTVLGSNIDTILGSLQLVAGSTGGNPTINISVTQSQSGLAYNSRNGHFYRAVTGTITRTNAASAAANVSNQFGGRTGYLVTITNDYENDFVASQIQNAQNIWIGASDTGREGRWIWDQGPENGTVFWTANCVNVEPGYSNSCGGFTGVSSYDGVNGVWQDWSSTNNHNKWCGVTDGRQTNQASTEPNNAYGSTGEDYAVTNWNGGTNSYSVDGATSTTHSCWNDLDNSYTGSIGGYVIEWGDATAFNNTFSRSFSVKFNQTITLVTAPAANSSVSTQTTTFNSTVDSGLTLSYSSSDTSVCTTSATAASGENVTVTLLRANANCTITISQAGNSNFSSATSIVRTFFSLYGRVSSCSGIGMLQNGGFETPTISGSTVRNDASQQNDQNKVRWVTTASDHQLELWRTGFLGVASAEGNQFAELNANEFGGLYQTISTIPGSTIRLKFKHRGRDGTESMRLLIGNNTGTTTYTTSTGATYSVPGTFSPATGISATKGATTSTNIEDGTSSWGEWTSSYTVPAGQTSTRFLFISYNPGSLTYGRGNLIDDVSFSPLVACPATFDVVKGRTVTLNPFDLDNDGNGGGLDAEDSFGWNDATVSSNDLTASAGTVQRVTAGGVSNRAISYTAPSSTGQQTINFTITNTDGDTSSSVMTINVVNESSVRNINTLPIDPQATTYNLKSFTIDAGPDSVLACVNSASNSSGTITSGVLVFDIATIESTDSVYSSGSNVISISGDRSDTLTLTGDLSTINSLISEMRVTRVGGGRFSDSKYIRIRSVPVIKVGQLSCSDAIASADRTLTLAPLTITRSKTVVVTIT